MNYNNYFLNKNFYFLFLLLSSISLNDCLIKIPLNLINVKGIQKYLNITIKEPTEFSRKLI